MLASRARRSWENREITLRAVERVRGSLTYSAPLVMDYVVWYFSPLVPPLLTSIADPS